MNLPYVITLTADGVEIPLPADSQGIILLNIDSYAGGVPLWSLGSKDDSLANSPVTSRTNSWNGSRGTMKRSSSLEYVSALAGDFFHNLIRVSLSHTNFVHRGDVFLLGRHVQHDQGNEKPSRRKRWEKYARSQRWIRSNG